MGGKIRGLRLDLAAGGASHYLRTLLPLFFIRRSEQGLVVGIVGRPIGLSHGNSDRRLVFSGENLGNDERVRSDGQFNPIDIHLCNPFADRVRIVHSDGQAASPMASMNGKPRPLWRDAWIDDQSGKRRADTEEVLRRSHVHPRCSPGNLFHICPAGLLVPWTDEVADLTLLTPSFSSWRTDGPAVGYGPGCGENGAISCHAHTLQVPQSSWRATSSMALRFRSGAPSPLITAQL